MKLFLSSTISVSILTLYISCQKTEVTAVDRLPDVLNKPQPEFELDLSKPIWQDEFEVDGLPNPKNWNYDLGGNGWGNQEKQNYTKEAKNARVEKGLLIIEAHKEKVGNNEYSSARLVTKNKADFLYGRFEIKAKLPKGVGTWPAIWMLATEKYYGDNYWPDNGEIDIMEHVGFDQNRIHGNIHTKAFNHAIGTNKGNNLVIKNASEEFHIYACNWTPESIEMEIDGVPYFKFNKTGGWEQWPFDKKFYLLLNIAVGGSWGGQKGIDDTIFPQRMEVDYVRVYGQKK